MNNTQLCILSALASAEYSEYSSEIQEKFQNFANELLNSEDPTIKRSVSPLLGDKIRNNKITGIGKASVSTNIKSFTNRHLSMQTLFHLKEVLQRNIMVKNSKTGEEGLLDYASDEMLKKLLEDVLDAIFDRYNPTNIENLVSESAVAFATELIAVYNSQQNNFAIESTMTVDDVVEVEKPKKTKKTKKAEV